MQHAHTRTRARARTHSHMGRVRAGPRNRPTQKKREEREVTRVPLRDRCTHFMMGGGRTHHHARRPTFAMDHYVMRMQPAVNSRTISEEAITCIAVNEDRHRTGSSYHVSLSRRPEEPCRILMEDEAPGFESAESTAPCAGFAFGTTSLQKAVPERTGDSFREARTSGR